MNHRIICFLNFSLCFLYGCMPMMSANNDNVEVAVFSVINNDINLNKYNNCYISTDTSSNLLSQKLKKILSQDLMDIGINIVKNKENANCFIEFKYDLSSKTTTINQPIWGETSINSINTTSLGSHSEYGSATTYGNMTTGNMYGTSMTASHSAVNYNYGIKGYVPLDVTNYSKGLIVSATSKNKIQLWNVYAMNIDSNPDIFSIFPYLSHVAASFAKIELLELTPITINKSELNYTYYEYENSVYRFYDNAHLFEQFFLNGGGWGSLRDRNIDSIIQEVKTKGKKISYTKAKRIIFNLGDGL